MKPAKTLTDWEIARALMSHLYDMYDRGGISVGRSKRSSLLEMITALTEVVQAWYDLGDNHLIELAMSRKKKKRDPQQLLLAPSVINFIPTEYLYLIILKKIWTWYKNHGYDNKGNRINICQWNVLRAIMVVLDVEYKLKQFKQQRVKFTYNQVRVEMKNRLIFKYPPEDFWEMEARFRNTL